MNRVQRICPEIAAATHAKHTHYQARFQDGYKGKLAPFGAAIAYKMPQQLEAARHRDLNFCLMPVLEVSWETHATTAAPGPEITWSALWMIS